MKIYFKSREKARKVAKNTFSTVKDMKDSPSINGSRWAVVINSKKRD